MLSDKKTKQTIILLKLQKRVMFCKKKVQKWNCVEVLYLILQNYKRKVEQSSNTNEMWLYNNKTTTTQRVACLLGIDQIAWTKGSHRPKIYWFCNWITLRDQDTTGSVLSAWNSYCIRRLHSFTCWMLEATTLRFLNLKKDNLAKAA